MGALLLTVLVSGCGGSGSASEGEVGEGLRGQAADVCTQAAALLEDVEWPDDAELDLQSAAPAIQQTTRIQRGMLDTLSQLDGEPAEQAAVQELVIAGQPIVAALESLEQASAAGDAEGFQSALEEVTARTESAAATSQRLGLSPCYTPA